MHPVDPKVFLKAAKQISNEPLAFSCEALYNLAGLRTAHTYRQIFAPTKGDRQQYRDRGITLGQGAWLFEYDARHAQFPLLRNFATVHHERLCFLAMAYALAEAGDFVAP